MGGASVTTGLPRDLETVCLARRVLTAGTAAQWTKGACVSYMLSVGTGHSDGSGAAARRCTSAPVMIPPGHVMQYYQQQMQYGNGYPPNGYPPGAHPPMPAANFELVRPCPSW
eukprot:gene9447-biopygen979